jgi:hypothetical protein
MKNARPRTYPRLTLVLLFSLLTSIPRASAQEPSVDPARLAEALDRYAHEPRVEELLAHVDDDEAFDPEAVRRLVRRARRGGWLPQLRVGVRRGRQQDLSTQASSTTTRVSTDDDLSLDASLTLRLDRAAYGPDEVSLARETRARAEARDARARLVVAAYFERRRLQLERDLLGRGDLATALRIHELEALLDALTSGAFSRERRRSEPRGRRRTRAR